MKVENNLIYYDFETTSNDPLSCNLLQATFIFVKNNKQLETINEYIIFDKKYEDINLVEKEGLRFNKILNQKDLDKHNSKAIKQEELFKKFENLINIYNFKFSYLTGWNNSGFDDIILRRKFIRGQLYYLRSRDILQRYLIIKEKIRFSSLKLSELHKKFIGTLTDLDFHDSLNDVIAVIDLDNYFNSNLIEVKI